MLLSYAQQCFAKPSCTLCLYHTVYWSYRFERNNALKMH